MMRLAIYDFSSILASMADLNKWQKPRWSLMDVIQEFEMTGEANKEDDKKEFNTEDSSSQKNDTGIKLDIEGFRLAPLKVLDNIKINIEPEIPASMMKCLCFNIRLVIHQGRIEDRGTNDKSFLLKSTKGFGY